MPTLQNPRQYFGYSRQPYEKYFEQRQQISTPPVNYDPYGQIGNEERQLAAQEKVFSVLGRLDAIDQAKQERDFAVQNAGQMRALREAQARDKMAQQQAEIGAWQRERQAEQEFSTLNPADPDYAPKFNSLVTKSREHFEIGRQLLPVQKSVYGDQLAGEEQRQEKRAMDQFKSKIDPRLRSLPEVTGAKTLAELEGVVTFKQRQNDTAKRLNSIGVNIKEFPSLMREDGSFDDEKVAAREYQQKQEMSPAQKRAELERLSDDRRRIMFGISEGKLVADDEAVQSELAGLNARINALGVGPPSDSPTQKKEAAAESKANVTQEQYKKLKPGDEYMWNGKVVIKK